MIEAIAVKKAIGPFVKPVLAILAGLLLLAALAWERRDAIGKAYESGELAERAAWLKAQQAEDARQRARESAAQAASDAATDAAAAQAQQATQKTADEARTTREAITHEFSRNPVAHAPCVPGAGHGPVPAGVLDQLNQARRAAEAAAR